MRLAGTMFPANAVREAPSAFPVAGSKIGFREARALKSPFRHASLGTVAVRCPPWRDRVAW